MLSDVYGRGFKKKKDCEELLGKEPRLERKTFFVTYGPLVPHHIQWCVKD